MCEVWWFWYFGEILIASGFRSWSMKFWRVMGNAKSAWTNHSTSIVLCFTHCCTLLPQSLGGLWTYVPFECAILSASALLEIILICRLLLQDLSYLLGLKLLGMSTEAWCGVRMEVSIVNNWFLVISVRVAATRIRERKGIILFTFLILRFCSSCSS